MCLTTSAFILGLSVLGPDGPVHPVVYKAISKLKSEAAKDMKLLGMAFSLTGLMGVYQEADQRVFLCDNDKNDGDI